MILLVVPGLVAVTASLAAALLHRRLRPAVAVPILTLLSTTSALAVLWSLGLLVVGFFGRVAWISERAAWCRALAHAHHAIPPAAGTVAITALIASADRSCGTNASGCASGQRAAATVSSSSCPVTTPGPTPFPAGLAASWSRWA